MLSATGTTLNIALSANESVTLRSTGSTYALTSNDTFFDGGVANPSEFSAFGTGSLTILATALARYDRLNITDAAANRITFEDSGANVYGDSIVVRFDNSVSTNVLFNGKTSLAAGRSMDVMTTGHTTVSAGATFSRLMEPYHCWQVVTWPVFGSGALNQRCGNLTERYRHIQRWWFLCLFRFVDREDLPESNHCRRRRTFWRIGGNQRRWQYGYRRSLSCEHW